MANRSPPSQEKTREKEEINVESGFFKKELSHSSHIQTQTTQSYRKTLSSDGRV